MSSAPLLVTRGLQTGYRSGGKKTLVSEQLPELTIKAGRLICLLGPNGSGKSTLLRTLAGLQPALHGAVEIAGRTGLPSSELARQISLVLTDRVGGSNLNVYSLVALGRYPWSGWLGTLDNTDREIIRRSVEAAGIDTLLERKVHTLSDGENQKVMLARALAQDTPILMLDEPTAHLDLPSRIRLMRLLHRLAREMNKGILLSTHELDLALQVADEVWLLQSAAPPQRGVTSPQMGGASPQRGVASLQMGAPEDLVLDGTFEAAFEREDVSFDRATGVFRIHPPGKHNIRLTATATPEGKVAEFWTRRALQREGFTVTEGETAWDVAIWDQAGGPVWRLKTPGADRQYNSIAGLLEALNDPNFS